MVAIVIDGHLILNHEISTWWIPVFVFTLELIIKATTSFAVFYMQKNDFNEGKRHKCYPKFLIHFRLHLLDKNGIKML